MKDRYPHPAFAPALYVLLAVSFISHSETARVDHTPAVEALSSHILYVDQAATGNNDGSSLYLQIPFGFFLINNDYDEK